MWITYTTKDGDTMDTIIAKQRIKDPATVLTHKNNKKIYKDLKAGKPLPKGTKVTIPDPKGKVYVVQTSSGAKYMDEATYKDYLKVVHEKMDEVIFKLKQRLTYAQGRHDSQLKINKDQWFVAACLDLVSSVPEPKSRKKAEATFSTAEKACKARNYKGFEKAVEPANIAIAKYKTETLAWIDGLINAGEGSVKVLEGVKTVGMVCGAVAATTVIAPAGLAAGMLTGATVGGGTSMAYNGFDSIGRAIAGTKQKSSGEIFEAAAKSALGGAAGAGIVGLFMKGAGPIAMRAASSNKFLTSQVQRIVARTPGNLGKIYAAEVKGVVKKLGIDSMDDLLAARPQILAHALTKFFSRVTMGSLNKKIGTGGEIYNFIEARLRGDPMLLQGKDPMAAAKKFVDDLLKSKDIEKIFDSIVKEHESKLIKILQQEIKAAAVKEMKKQKA